MESRQAWVDAEDLQIGDVLVSSTGDHLDVDATTVFAANVEAVHNLTVAGLHTFYVMAGDQAVLVHNCGGGGYGDVRRSNTGGQVHHTPASAVSPYTHHTGPSIWMETADHKLTASWGRSKAAQAYRQRQADLIAQGKIRKAVQMDIDDIRSKFGNKYDNNIREMLEAFGGEL